MYLAIVMTIAIAVYSIVTRICECIEYIHTESEKRDENTEDNNEENKI